MNKKEVQKRVSKNGKPLALNKFMWDAKTNTFASAENKLVIDFSNINYATITAGGSATITTGCSATITAGYYATITAGNYPTITAGCSATITAGGSATIKAGDYPTITAGSSATITAGYSATIKAGYYATIKAGSSATITAGNYATITVGYYATITAGSSATITAGNYATITVGYYATIKAGSSATITAGNQCVIVRRDIFEVYTLDDKTIKLTPSSIPGYVDNGCYSVTGKPAIIADGILSEVLSERTKDGLIIRKVVNHGSAKNTYLVERDGVFSHGAALKQAVDSLKYKISERDTSQYNEYTPDTELTQAEAIKMYRVITGACETGTRSFVESLENPAEKLTVAELIELTKGQYKNEEIEAFINQTTARRS